MSYANLMGLARRKSLFPTTGEASNVTTRQREEKKKKPAVTDLHGSAAVFGIVCHCKTRPCQLETWLLARGRASVWVVWCRDWVNVRRNGPALQRSHGLTFDFFFFWLASRANLAWAYLACLSRGSRLPLTNRFCLRIVFITQGPVGQYPSSEQVIWRCPDASTGGN